MKTAQEIIIDLYADMTDEEIAEAVGSSQPTIWRIRTGATKDCSASLYMALMTLHATNLTAGDTAKAA